MSRRANPFFDHGDIELFLARADGRVVGRVAAIDNPAFNAFHGTRQGFFGLFDCADDPAAARALLAAAAAWLRHRGHERLLGPVNLTTHDECGLLVDGFDEPPAVLMPYHPPYYARLLEHGGLAPAMELLAWEIPSTVHQDPRARRLARYAGRVAGLRVRPLDPDDFAAEAAAIRRLYNVAWADNWGFSPLSEREFTAMARQLRRLLRPGLALIAEVDGAPVAFSLAVPDVAPALRAARGRLHAFGLPLGLVRYLRAARHVDRIRVLAAGVLAEYRHRGLEVLLHVEMSRTARRLGFRTAEVSWILADNRPANHSIERLGGRITKRYALYAGAL
ncbi:N-acetyltransferase family protein [Streptomyces sp. URMC 123]|uniref:GNAT family N-acetyltransferase n=1 Tax=Streptomyces sp. URMC 123 TaxID=3423403 RepID=UPI003F1ACD09